MWSITCTNDNSACLYFLIMFPDLYFDFISGLHLSNRLKYLNDTLKDYVTGQHKMSHARMKTLLFSVYEAEESLCDTPCVRPRVRALVRIKIFSFCT